MLAYFPQIYPGELLYSVVARYLRHVGAMGQTTALTALFGRRFVIASPDLPGHLDALSQRISPDRDWSVDRLINEATLFPYYTAFQPPAVRAAVREAMRAGNACDLHLRLGLAAFRTARVTTLRFCPNCLTLMRALYGETYWRREHQLPGAVMCFAHETILRPSTVELACRGRHEFVAATAVTCPPATVREIDAMSPSAHAFLQRVTQASVALLTDPPAARSFDEWTGFYRMWMLRAGLARSPRRMDQASLSQALSRHVSQGMRYLPSTVGTFETPTSWLGALVRKHRKATHPLLHVLLQDVLAARSSPKPPFGTGPWPCFNPLVRHRLSLPVKVMALHRNRGRVVGVFRCRCGYVYTQNVDPRSGVNGPPRFQVFGPRLRPALEKWLTAGLALREIGRRLALDPKTVVSLAADLGLSTPWTCSARQRASNAATFNVNSARVNKSRSSRQQRAPAPARRNWTAIDRACVRDIRRAADIIRRMDPPMRVTRAEIERRAHRRDWLSPRRDKLPLAFECLQRETESVETFQLRRIHWAIREITHEHGAVKAWQVMRKAGLRGSALPRIQTVLDMSRPRRSAVA